MDFVPEFAPDAESQGHELGLVLQELVWDKVEEVVHTPPPDSRDSSGHRSRGRRRLALHFSQHQYRSRPRAKSR